MDFGRSRGERIAWSAEIVATAVPRSVIRKAFETNLTEHGRVWMDALDARNRMSHTYDFQKFEVVIENIRDRYLAAMEDLYMFLLEKEADNA